MKKGQHKVLLLEAGGPCGTACVKLLRKNKDIEIIAADMSPYCASFEMADQGFVIPSAKDPKFPQIVADLVKNLAVSSIVPCFEHGISSLTDILVPFGIDALSAESCQDKLKFNNLCLALDLPVPETEILTDKTKVERFPKYIKPRKGVGSRDNFICHSQKEFDAIKGLLNLKDQFLMEEYLIGDHWNVDVLVVDGKFICAVPRRDLVQKAGNCITVEIKNYTKLIKFAESVQKKIGLKSPFNLEVFENSAGNFIINEINPRFGGGVIFSAQAGVNMVEYFVTKNPKSLGKISEGIYTRYYEEVKITKIARPWTF